MSTAARARQEPRRLEFVASEIANLPGVETHAYRAGEVLLPTERLKRLHICVRDGALGLRLAVGRANHAILDVFGPGSLLTPQLWQGDSTAEGRHAAAPANLGRQTTNPQLRRLARAGLAGLERRVVDVHDLAALRGVAAGRRPAPR